MHTKLHSRALVLSAVLGFSALALWAGDSPNDDKNQYSLFNPTPASLLRPISTGEFEDVQNPFTIDAGHFQIDANFIDSYSETRRETFPGAATFDLFQQELVWSPTFRLGLCNHVDLEVEPEYENFSQHQTVGNLERFYVGSGGSFVETYSRESFGYTDIGPRINLWGNDTGVTALAVSPYIGVPANGGDVLGGIDVPFAVRLPMDFMIKYAPGLYATENGRKVVHGELANHFAVDKTFFGKLTTMANLNVFSSSRSGQRGWGYTGFGASYEITPNLLLYAVMRFGIGDAYDYNPYAGVAWRF